MPISGPILQDKALEFYEELKEKGEPEFRALAGLMEAEKRNQTIEYL